MVDLKPDDIKTGKTYRAKRPKRLAFTNAHNDRTVLWMSSVGSISTKVQYNSPAVHIGRRYPIVPMEKFLKWASHEVEGTNG